MRVLPYIPNEFVWSNAFKLQPFVQYIALIIFGFKGALETASYLENIGMEETNFRLKQHTFYFRKKKI